MSWTLLHQADFAHVDLLQARFHEAAAGVDVVVGELLLHLRQAQTVGDQLIGIDAHLVFARGTAEGGDIHDIRHGFQVLLHHPVFNGFQLHHVVLRIGAVQREEVDLADRAPIGAHLRAARRRQRDLREPLQHALAIPGVVRVIVENQLQVGEAEDARTSAGAPPQECRSSTISSGMVTCCSICSAEIPGHCVIIST